MEQKAGKFVKAMDEEEKVCDSYPLIGQKFPESVCTATKGTIHLPEDMAKKWFIILSHPADFTPVCTTEIATFSKRYSEFKKLNCELFSLSIDQIYSHESWINWIKEKLNIVVPFPIIADEEKRLASKLGMIHKTKRANTVRGLFIVDPEATIRLIQFYPHELGRSVEEVLRALKGLQTVDKNQVMLPEGWPKNSLIGDSVILQPGDKKNADKICYDTWFCHAKLPQK